MKNNMGIFDRALRVVIAIIIATLIYLGNVTGTAAIILGIIAGVMFLTALLSFCPLYMPFRLSTKSKKSN